MYHPTQKDFFANLKKIKNFEPFMQLLRLIVQSRGTNAAAEVSPPVVTAAIPITSWEPRLLHAM